MIDPYPDAVVPPATAGAGRVVAWKTQGAKHALSISRSGERERSPWPKPGSCI